MEQCEYSPNTGDNFVADVMLPCPFCGKRPELTFIGNDHAKTRKVEIKCEGCRATIVNKGIRFNYENLARLSIADWNRRFLK